VVFKLIDRLSARDVEIVRDCLTAAVHGPLFPDWEFSTLIGCTRDEANQVFSDWPASGDAEDQDVVVNNVLNNLIGYPHGGRRWSEFISASPDEVAHVFARWRGEG
jgi:hypothetical protein